MSDIVLPERDNASETLAIFNAIESCGSRVPKSGRFFQLKHFAARACIYFLISRRQIVYVGQSTNLLARIVDHARNGLSFDDVRFVYIKRKLLNRVEAELICRLRPCLNRDIPHGVLRTTRGSHQQYQSLSGAWVPKHRKAARVGASARTEPNLRASLRKILTCARGRGTRT